jgi:hypothetical protein
VVALPDIQEWEATARLEQRQANFFQQKKEAEEEVVVAGDTDQMSLLVQRLVEEVLVF